MERIESTHKRVSLTVGDRSYDLAFPAEIGDGEGQIPEAVAEVLVSISRFPGEYQRVADAPVRTSAPEAEPGLAEGEGHERPADALDGDDQAAPARPRRGRKVNPDGGDLG